MNFSTRSCVVGGVLAAGPVVVLVAAAIGCAGTASGTARAGAGGALRVEVFPFEAELRAAAAGYKQFERVSDQAWIAPFLCREPLPSPRPVQLQSGSSDDATHGRKLYFLYASDAGAYTRVSWSYQPESPVGQTLVKETWSWAVVDEEVQAAEEDDMELPETHAWDGERVVRMDAPGDLFIMLRMERATPGTDEGWVYGVVSRDGREVKAAGMIESCIGCHAKTGRDRLFGPPLARGRLIQLSE